MLEIGPVLDGGKHQSRFISKGIADGAGKSCNDSIPIAQGTKEAIHVAMPGVPGIVPNPHGHAGGLDLVYQFDQRKMCFQKIRLAATLGVAGVLRFAEGMPGIIAAPARGKFDGIAFSNVCFHRSVFTPNDDIFTVDDDGRMTRQPDRRSLGALYMYVKEQCVQRRHVHQFFFSVFARP